MDDKLLSEIKKAELDGSRGEEYYGHNHWAAEANKNARAANNFNGSSTGPSIPVHPQKRWANFILIIGALFCIPALSYGPGQHILSFVVGLLLIAGSLYFKISRRKYFAEYDPSKASTFKSKKGMQRKHPHSKKGLTYQEVEDLYKS